MSVLVRSHERRWPRKAMPRWIAVSRDNKFLTASARWTKDVRRAQVFFLREIRELAPDAIYLRVNT